MILSFSVSAKDIVLNNVTDEEISGVFDEFTHYFNHTSFSSYKDKNIEVGVLTSLTTTPILNSKTQTEGIPSVNLLLKYSRWNFTLMGQFQDLKIANVQGKYKTLGGSYDYETKYLWIKPTFRYLKNDVSYNQITKNDSTNQIPIDTDIVLENTIKQYSLTLYKPLKYGTPYVTGGLIQSDTSLNILTQGVSIFSETSILQSQTSFTRSDEVPFFGMGVEFPVRFMRFGIDYYQLLGVNKASFKISSDF